MASVVTFTALLFLFMFTFAVLGMNLFGGKMSLPSSDCRTDNVRSNFDTFPSAMVTVFQVTVFVIILITRSSRFSLMYRGLYTAYKPPNLI